MSLTRKTGPLRIVPFNRPSLDEREYRAVREVLESGWITTGEKTREFERRFAEYVGARHALAVNSCTAALHMALAAEDIGPDHDTPRLRNTPVHAWQARS